MNSIVIINPYKSAGYAYGIACTKFTSFNVIGLWTSEELKNKWVNSTPHEMLNEQMVNSVNTVEMLKEKNVRAFLVGDDEAFLLADKLQAEFFPSHCNDVELQVVRSNKFQYLSYLADRGLVKTKQELFDDGVEDFSGLKILKPINGAGNENVFFTRSLAEAKQYASKFLDTQFLIQDFVDGEEFCVELVSCGDDHKCTTVMKYGRKYFVDGVSPWRYDNDLVEPDERLIEYVKSVVSALGVKVGVTWTQVIKHGDEFHLVEVNFRGQGHGHFKAVFESTGNCYSIECLKAYCSPEKFRSNLNTYTKRGEFKKLCVNNQEIRFVNSIDISAIEKLPSVISIWPNDFIIPGQLEKTTTFKNTMAMIILQNLDVLQFEKDFKLIQQWQETIECSS